MITEIITKIFFLIAVIDPLGSVPVFLEATKQLDQKHKKKVAIRASFIAFLILLFFIVVGQLILDGMEVTLDAFQISGGVILFLFALTMIFGEGKPESEKHMINDYRHVTIFPVAIPSIASPGAIMALTGNPDINKYAINKFSKQFGENGAYRLVTTQEMLDDTNNPEDGLFSHNDDFSALLELTRAYPSIQEIDLEDKVHYDKLIKISNEDPDIIPLFVKDNEGEFHIISSHNLEFENIEAGYQLVYLGKPFDVDEVPTVEPSTNKED